jgi:hypothetical protein
MQVRLLRYRAQRPQINARIRRINTQRRLERRGRPDEHP